MCSASPAAVSQGVPHFHLPGSTVSQGFQFSALAWVEWNPWGLTAFFLPHLEICCPFSHSPRRRTENEGMDYIANRRNRQMDSLTSVVTHRLFQGREELKFQSSKAPHKLFLPHLVGHKQEALAGKDVSGIAETQH